MASTSPIISSEIAACFRSLRARRQTALIPYITAGYPGRADTPVLLRALADAGADIIELGVPFSDPVADGPTIQRSSQKALEEGITLHDTLDYLADFRAVANTPVVLFSYLNPLLTYGIDRFISAAQQAGAQGVLVVDLPLGADAALESALQDSPLDLIRLLAPTTEPERAREIASCTQGFLYYVARLGVTGAREQLRAELLTELAALRSVSAVPIAVGFGISSAEQARMIARTADGIVVGSALIDALDRAGISGAQQWLREIRAGLDGG